MSLSATKTKCYAGIFKRLNYFYGMLLKEEDLQQEQEYLREKAKLHNRLHGYGVVWGLGLTAKCIPVGETSAFKIFIEPGFAIDRAGNEILVCQPHRVDVEAKLLDLRRACATLDPPPTLCIGMEYCECKSNPELQHLSLQCDDDSQPTQFSRVREGYNVRIFTEEELPECCKPAHARAKTGHTQDEPDCLGLPSCCGEQCVIILGCIKDYFPANKPDYGKDPNYVTYPFPPECIDPCYRPPTVHTGHADAQWEQQKQVVLHAACAAFHWVDLSPLLHQSVAEAQAYLGQHNLAQGVVLAIGHADIDAARLMERIERSVSCVAEGTKIDLIIDQHQCVLFAIPQ